jgi:hypothetical protein
MKINLGKLLRVLGRVIVAAPAIIDAVKPVLRKPRRSERESATGPTTPPPGSGRPLGAPTVTPE